MSKIAFAAVLSMAGVAASAQAQCSSPYCQGGRGFGGGFGGSRAMPAFQAAPWYLYWPYNQHFMTPAPMGGAYSAPPGGGYGGGMVNPYFPGGYGYGQPAPGGYAPPAPMPAAPAPLPAGTVPPLATPPAGTPGVSIPAVPGIIRTSGRR